MPRITTTSALVILSWIAFIATVHGEDLTIPVLVAQTGDAALFGQSETEGYVLAVEEWNARGGVGGRRVVLHVEDIQTDQRQMMTAYQRLSLNGIPALLGPTWLDTFQALLPVARRRGTLLITPSSAREAFTDSAYGGMISFYNNTRSEIRTLVDELEARGLKRVALVYEQEPFAELLRKLVLERAPAPVVELGVQTGEADFLSLIPKLRAAKTDAVLLFIWHQRSLLSFLEQLRTQLPAIQLATCHDAEGWLKTESIRSVLGRVFFTSFELADPSFAPRFEKRFGHPPLLTASNAYDAISSLLKARAAGKNSPDEIRKWILSEELDTVTFGRFRFGSDGSVVSKVRVLSHPN